MSSHSRLHGSNSYRVPWLVDDESVEVVRAFARLKCRLMPYLYQAAVEASRSGVPLAMRQAISDESGKRDAWLHVLTLDGEAPLAEPRLSEAEMAEVAEQALKELPEAARKLIANVPIVIVDSPARQEVEQGMDPRLLGMFEGTAYSDGGTLGGAPQVTQILLFRKNLERMAVDTEDLREQIRITLLHETGHFFGMSEDDLAGVGLD